MRPTSAYDPNIDDLDVILQPGAKFEHPRDVLNHPALTTAEKRAILASSAAVSSCPELRSLAGLAAPVSIDDIVNALRALDDRSPPRPGGKPYRLRSTERALAA
jgi:hypothetical protein